MTNQNPNPNIAAASDAIRALLSTMLGDTAPLRFSSGQPIDPGPAGDDALSLLGILPDGGSYAVMLDPEWLPLIAGLKLGVSTRVGDDDFEAVATELAGHFFEAVRTHFATSGSEIKPTSFLVKAPGDELPNGLLDGIEQRIPFFMEWDGAMLHGHCLISHAVAPASQAPESEPQIRVEAADFPDLGTESIGSGPGTMGSLGLLGDVELEVTVELGRRRMPLADILRLTSGSVLELEKLVGEPLQVYANNRLIADGEAVVIDDQFGVRITSLAQRSLERMSR